MSGALRDPNLALQALEPRLLDWAVSLTRDPQEAESLVQDTLRAARDLVRATTHEAEPDVWIFRLLRQRFYSLERDRGFRRSRSTFATEQAYARKRAELAQAMADGSVVAIDA